jgi:hypothetical protein
MNVKYLRTCECGKPYYAKGLCKSCYNEQYRNDPKHKDRIKKQKDQWYQDNKDLNAMKQERADSGLRERALKRDHYRCVKCRAEKKLVVHHKDGEGRNSRTPNNRLTNLETLCKDCHLEEHRDELQASRKWRKNGWWAREYDRCVQCGSNERRHNGHGLCVNCYAQTHSKG